MPSSACKKKCPRRTASIPASSDRSHPADTGRSSPPDDLLRVRPLSSSPTRRRPRPNPSPYTPLFRSRPPGRRPPRSRSAGLPRRRRSRASVRRHRLRRRRGSPADRERSEEHTSELQPHSDLVCRLLLAKKNARAGPRPSQHRATAHTRPTPAVRHPQTTSSESDLYPPHRHDAALDPTPLPTRRSSDLVHQVGDHRARGRQGSRAGAVVERRSDGIAYGAGAGALPTARDRKSTRLNSSHTVISYAVFCLQKKMPAPDRVHPSIERPLTPGRHRPFVTPRRPPQSPTSILLTDTTPPSTQPLSLHAALPISSTRSATTALAVGRAPAPAP